MKHNGIDSEPCLFWAWYASATDRSEAGRQAQAWWERIDARYLAMTGDHVLDPIRYVDP